MKFIIKNPQNLGVMSTEYPECVPNREILREMSNYGYKFYLNGKKISVNEAEKLREN